MNDSALALTQPATQPQSKAAAAGTQAAQPGSRLDCSRAHRHRTGRPRWGSPGRTPGSRRPPPRPCSRDQPRGPRPPPSPRSLGGPASASVSPMASSSGSKARFTVGGKRKGRGAGAGSWDSRLALSIPVAGWWRRSWRRRRPGARSCCPDALGFLRRVGRPHTWAGERPPCASHGSRPLRLLFRKVRRRTPSVHRPGERDVGIRGIAYRDRKPGNSPAGTPGASRNRLFLTDLGLAKTYRGNRTRRHIPRRGDTNLTGTARSASFSAHPGIAQSPGPHGIIGIRFDVFFCFLF